MADAGTVPVRRPAFQFYPADWRNDAALRMCSLAARGLWIEALSLMHAGRPYGHLVTATGLPLDHRQVAMLVGTDVAEVEACFAELWKYGIYSVADDGSIFSRRMVEDERVRNARAAGGHLGADHGHKGKQHGAKGAAHGQKGGRPRGSGGGK